MLIIKFALTLKKVRTNKENKAAIFKNKVKIKLYQINIKLKLS